MNCPNCKSSETKLFHDKVWSTEDGKVYQCLDCDLLFIHPMMNEEEEAAFYENYNNHVKQRGAVDEASNISFHEKSLVIANERLSVISSFFSDQYKVLEVGSSTGAFLSLLPEHHTFACELNDENRRASEKFITGASYSSIESISEDSFDVICLFHVFEHFRDPMAFLQRCAALLSEQGIVIIEVPCANDPLISLYDCKEFKDFVFQPMHPMVYSEKSLDYVFEKSGFIKTKVIYYQRYGLANHLSWFKNKKPGGDRILESFFSCCAEYKTVLESRKKTDTIFYIARLS